MAIKSGFFNSVDKDRRYNADDLSQFFYGLISDGIIDDTGTASSMKVEPGTDLGIKVLPGRAVLRTKYVMNDEDHPIALLAADSTNPRIDRIVLHLNTSPSVRSITVIAKSGTPAARPSAPALTRTGTIYELSLAQIYVGAAATSVTAANITDERPDRSVCGFCGFVAPSNIAADAGEGAIITHAVRDVTAYPDAYVVDIRCHDISAVTPASESWATGSCAWEIPSGDFYALDTDGTWKKVSS